MEIEILFNEFEDVLEWDDKAFKFLEENYDIVSYILENKLQNYYYWVGALSSIKSEDLAKAEKINQQYMVNGLLRNPNVSGKWLERKLKSTDSSIVERAARHKNLPLKLFKKIDTIENQLVKRAMLRNESCPREILVKYFENSVNEPRNKITSKRPTLIAIAQNSNLPNEILGKMVSNHKEYHKEIDEILKFNNFDSKGLAILEKAYGNKKSDMYDKVLLNMTANKHIKTNKDMQDYFCLKIYQQMDNNFKHNTIDKVAPYIESNNIEILMKKIHIDYLVTLTKNPKLPTSKATDIIIDAKIFHVNEMYDGYDFSQDELYSITVGAPDVRSNNFFNKFKHLYSSTTLMDLFRESNDEKYLPSEAKEMFIF